MKLTPERRDEVLIKLYTCILGIEGTDDSGMAGIQKEMLEHLKVLNGQVHDNTTFRKVGTWISGAIVISIITLLVKIFFGG